MNLFVMNEWILFSSSVIFNSKGHHCLNTKNNGSKKSTKEAWRKRNNEGVTLSTCWPPKSIVVVHLVTWSRKKLLDWSNNTFFHLEQVFSSHAHTHTHTYEKWEEVKQSNILVSRSPIQIWSCVLFLIRTTTLPILKKKLKHCSECPASKDSLFRVGTLQNKCLQSFYNVAFYQFRMQPLFKIIRCTFCHGQLFFNEINVALKTYQTVPFVK